MSTDTLARDRHVAQSYPAHRTLEGDGIEVRRALPSRTHEAIGPFIFLDHFGPISVAPGEAKGASAHPHAGIETLSLLLEGSIRHKDSIGNESVMGPGEVQWMRAGRGVIHDESPEAAFLRDGGQVHGVQLWVNMPRGEKHADPAYRHVTRDEIPLLAHPTGTIRLVAGRVGEHAGPVETTGHPFVVHASMPEGASLDLDTGDADELAIYVLTGAVTLGSATIEAGFIAPLSPGDRLRLEAEPGTDLILVGGDSLDAPIVRHGPFVMNTITELEQAVRDYQAGRMGRI